MRHLFVLVSFFLLFPAAARAGGKVPISGAEVWNERGIESFRRGDYRSAVTCFETAHTLLPENETVRFNLASAHARLALGLVRGTKSAAALQGALLEAEEAVFLEERHAYFHGVVGLVRQEMGNHEEAYRAFSRAAALDPGDGGTRALLGNAAYELDDLEGAMKQWSKALELEPGLENIDSRLRKATKEIDLEENYRSMESGDFRLRFDPASPGADREAARILEMLEGIRRDVLRTLPCEEIGSVSVVLYARDDFARLMEGHDWTGGLYDGKIRIPFPEEGESDEALLVLATHEFVHAVVYALTGDRCPAWLNEGLAQVLAGEWDSSRGRMARRLCRDSSFVPLSDLEEPFLTLPQEKVDLAYAESYLVVDHVLRGYTARHLRRLLERIGAGVPPGDAVREILRVQAEDLLDDAVARCVGIAAGP